MTTQAEAFQNIVGINFSDAVVNELKCARVALSKIETEDKELAKTLDHVASHLDAAGALAFFMKDYYGEKANLDKDIHTVALKEFEESNLIKLMKEILDVATDTEVASDLAELLKLLDIANDNG